MSEAKFKKIAKINRKEFALDDLNEKKFTHSKMGNLVYTELKIQDYLMTEDISSGQKRIIFTSEPECLIIVKIMEVQKNPSHAEYAPSIETANPTQLSVMKR